MQNCRLQLHSILIIWCLCHLWRCSRGRRKGTNSPNLTAWANYNKRTKWCILKMSASNWLSLRGVAKITAAEWSARAFICLLFCQSTFSVWQPWPALNSSSVGPAAGNVWSLLRKGSVWMSTAGPTSQESWSFFPLWHFSQAGPANRLHW